MQNVAPPASAIGHYMWSIQDMTGAIDRCKLFLALQYMSSIPYKFLMLPVQFSSYSIHYLNIIL